MPKKKHDEHEEHVNEEAWVIPYADMLTLLMALFLVLWAMGTTDVNKAKAVGAGFASELGIGPGGGKMGGGGSTGESQLNGGLSVTGAAAGEITDLQKKLAEADTVKQAVEARAADVRAEQKELAEAQKQIQADLDAKGLGNEVQMRLEPQGLIVVATEGLLFGSGSAALEETGKHAIDIVAEPMKTMSQPVRIEGHTDSTPIATAQYPSNWELSSARAASVLRYLVTGFGFPADRLSSAGYADTRPVSDNGTAEGRAANRRVEIVMLATKATEPLTTTETTDGGVTVPAPIGPDGPTGVPEPVIPNLPGASASTASGE